ncbi:MAG: GTPase HflX [Clostridia bacterium]|nr:GTPase HflX [Clostridia bacterium]
MKKEVSGNTQGIRNSILERMEKLFEVKSDASILCDEFIISEICEISFLVNREIAVYISQRGIMEYIAFGDFATVSLQTSDISKRARCIHTHPSGGGELSALDLDTLKKTDLLLMAAVSIKNGRPAGIYCAYIGTDGNPVREGPYFSVTETAALISDAASSWMVDPILTETGVERVIAAGVTTHGSKALLDELAELISSAGGICVHKEEQSRDGFDAAYYMGKGKIEEIRNLCSIHDADTVVFDDSLSPGQIRNIENMLSVKILDRSSLILDIFAQRAHSKEGKIQVELAQLTYMLPRLTGRGIELSRLGGGIGTRGPGETKLETDRRHILRRITYLKRELAGVGDRREILRDNRKKNNAFVIALAGYTNTGKSTLVNKLTDSSIMAEDMLFATLDPSARKLTLPSGEDVVLVDTVGFVSKLPHELVEAFKSSLEEVSDADLILHILDGKSPDMDRQKDIVYKIFNEIGAGQIPVIEVVNKIDAAGGRFGDAVNSRERIYISALTGQGTGELIKAIELAAEGLRVSSMVDVPYNMGRLISYIHDNTDIITKEYMDDFIRFELKLTKKSLSRIHSELFREPGK